MFTKSIKQILLTALFFCCLPGSAQLPVNPNQYVPQPNYTMGVSGNVQPMIEDAKFSADPTQEELDAAKGK